MHLSSALLQISVSAHNKSYTRAIHKADILEIEDKQCGHIKFYGAIYLLPHLLGGMMVQFSAEIGGYNLSCYIYFY